MEPAGRCGLKTGVGAIDRCGAKRQVLGSKSDCRAEWACVGPYRQMYVFMHAQMYVVMDWYIWT